MTAALKPRSLPPAHAVALVSLLVLVIALALHTALPTPAPQTLLSLLATGQFAWAASTTDIPISAVSVVAKAVLSRDLGRLPPALHPLVSPADEVPMQALRDHFNAARLRRVRAHCARHPDAACNPAQVDPRFGLTPLHVAAFAHDEPLVRFLEARGARPAPDHAGRLPRNLSFAHFIRNAKAARAQKEEQSPAADTPDCDFPVADFAADPAHARRETARLVAEGEPVLLRGALAHYAPQLVPAWDPDAWAARFADVPVRVGAVPYARAFNLSTRDMPLREFYDRFVRGDEADNLYAFNKHPAVCRDGYEALARVVADAMPVGRRRRRRAHNGNGNGNGNDDRDDALLAHPDDTGALDGIHFFLGRAGSGAPFHVHGDAVNAAVHGRKRWFVYTPARTIYSRTPVAEWVERVLPTLGADERPLECVQKPGDVVYVPLDWGHGVLNLDDKTFGFALELLNRRDTYAHLTGHA